MPQPTPARKPNPLRALLTGLLIALAVGMILSPGMRHEVFTIGSSVLAVLAGVFIASIVFLGGGARRRR